MKVSNKGSNRASSTIKPKESKKSNTTGQAQQNKGSNEKKNTSTIAESRNKLLNEAVEKGTLSKETADKVKNFRDQMYNMADDTKTSPGKGETMATCYIPAGGLGKDLPGTGGGGAVCYAAPIDPPGGEGNKKPPGGEEEPVVTCYISRSLQEELGRGEMMCYAIPLDLGNKDKPQEGNKAKEKSGGGSSGGSGGSGGGGGSCGGGGGTPAAGAGTPQSANQAANITGGSMAAQFINQAANQVLQLCGVNPAQVDAMVASGRGMSGSIMGGAIPQGQMQNPSMLMMSLQKLDIITKQMGSQADPQTQMKAQIAQQIGQQTMTGGQTPGMGGGVNPAMGF